MNRGRLRGPGLLLKWDKPTKGQRVSPTLTSMKERGQEQTLSCPTHIAAAESPNADNFRVQRKHQRETMFEYWKRHEFSTHILQHFVCHARERSIEIGSSTFSL